MRAPLVFLVCLLLFFGPAADADEQKPAEKPKPLTPEQAAEKVLAAVTAKDNDALKALAKLDAPDPWLVADLLCYRGAHDAAEAFSKAAPRKRIEKLPRYVAARRGAAPDEAARAALAAIKAAQSQKKWNDVVEGARAVAGPLDSVVRLRVGLERGRALGRLRKHRESVNALAEVGEAAARVGWLWGACAAFYDGGKSAYYDSDFAGAVSAWNSVLTIAREIDHTRGVTLTLGRLGLAHAKLGEYAQALRHYEESLGLHRQLDDKQGLARLLNNIGNMQMRLRNYPEALENYDESLALRREADDKRGIATVLTGIGVVRHRLRDYPEALRHFDEALTINRDLRDNEGIGQLLLNIGNVHRARDNYVDALKNYEASLAIRRELGNKSDILAVLFGIGNVQLDLENYPEALEAYAGAQQLLDAFTHPPLKAHVLWGMAEVHLRQDRPALAVGFARRVAEFVSGLAEGLADEEGARARDHYSGIFETGILASLRAGLPRDLLWFLEQGRAGSLREALGSRAELEAAVIPPDLLEALTVARHEERQALKAYQRAQGGGHLKTTGAARAAWQEARSKVGQVSARVQREAKAAASITLAAPDDIDTIQASVGPGEALVLFGLTKEEAVALVVRKNGARIVELPASNAIKAAVDALLGDDEHHVVPENAPALRKLLIEPLKLGPDVRRVLVSPTWRLGYIPFALLLPGMEVAYVPSGTTLGLLVEERAKRGEDILALGDPDYGAAVNEASPATHRGAGARLPRLPGSGAEVEAVGTIKLLSKQATETGLQDAIKQRQRWRAIHFACHGLVDPERPMFSSLALTATAEDDGFLTALEIFRMRIPADLVVLSACETGKGKVYRTEGIVGLTRAFMFAGAPRVICSLWKVDDEATQALMIKFYELWNPRAKPGDPERPKGVEGSRPLGAAAALKQSQAFIRGHEKWKHPYYWAAWVLWGLPD